MLMSRAKSSPRDSVPTRRHRSRSPLLVPKRPFRSGMWRRTLEREKLSARDYDDTAENWERSRREEELSVSRTRMRISPMKSNYSCSTCTHLATSSDALVTIFEPPSGHGVPE